MRSASNVVNRAILGLCALSLVLGTAVVGIAGCSQSGESLYKSKCSSCHSLSKVEDSTYAKSGQWDDVVARMQSSTTTISDSDASAIIEYLNQTYPGSN